MLKLVLQPHAVAEAFWWLRIVFATDSFALFADVDGPFASGLTDGLAGEDVGV